MKTPVMFSVNDFIVIETFYGEATIITRVSETAPAKSILVQVDSNGDDIEDAESVEYHHVEQEWVIYGKRVDDENVRHTNMSVMLRNHRDANMYHYGF